MKVSRPDTRTIAARISRRHGAWLIQFHESNDRDGTTTPDEVFDCASSLRVAKRVTRQGAIELGWRPPFQWIEDPDSLSVLLMGLDNDGIEYDDEEES